MTKEIQLTQGFVTLGVLLRRKPRTSVRGGMRRAAHLTQVDNLLLQKSAASSKQESEVTDEV